MPKTAHGETEAGSCMGVIIVTSESAYFSCKLTQEVIWLGPFTMPDCVPKDGNRKARASAQPERWARVCVSCKLRGEQCVSACLQPCTACLQPCLCQGAGKSETAPRKCTWTAWWKDCAAARETREDAAAAWLASPEAVLLWAPALQCTTQIVLFQGHCLTLHPLKLPSSPLKAKLPCSLVCFWFCFTKGTVENRKNQKYLVLSYQKSRSELWSLRKYVTFAFVLAQEQIFAFSPCCPRAAVSLLRHTQAIGKQNMFFSSFLLSAPKIMKYDNDIINS